jgi:putative Holliday junction resolvase
MNYPRSSLDRVAALGLDVGNRRIGVAGCDGTGLIATGLGVIYRKSWIADRAAVHAWIEKRQAQILVVGLPLLADGSVGSQAKKVYRFMQSLQDQIDLPIDYVNEYLTTVQASWDLQAAGIQAKQQKQVIDQQAAAVILQEWLDRRRQRQSQGALPQG